MPEEVLAIVSIQGKTIGVFFEQRRADSNVSMVHMERLSSLQSLHLTLPHRTLFVQEVLSLP